MNIKTKGDLMKAVYTEQELRSIDSAIPIQYWNGVDPSIQVDTLIHVMNYNSKSAFGELENMLEIAKQRKIKIEWAQEIQS